MPNEAKLGLFTGVIAVIAVALLSPNQSAPKPVSVQPPASARGVERGDPPTNDGVEKSPGSRVTVRPDPAAIPTSHTPMERIDP